VFFPGLAPCPLIGFAAGLLLGLTAGPLLRFEARFYTLLGRAASLRLDRFSASLLLLGRVRPPLGLLGVDRVPLGKSLPFVRQTRRQSARGRSPFVPQRLPKHVSDRRR
jgi:hypothetical protein